MQAQSFLDYRYQFPHFITDSKLVSQNVELTKIFPQIGLPNDKEHISQKIDVSHLQIDQIVHLAIKKFLSQWENDGPILEELKGLELFKVAKTLFVLKELNSRLNKKYGIDIIKNKLILTDPIISYDGSALIRKRADAFLLVKKLLHLNRYFKADLHSPQEIANACKKLKLVFASSDLDGAWDIVTMSMRGIKSCMRWEARQSSSLIGSVADPCCGVIYLTNGEKTTYGSKMLFRSVVRLVLHRLTNKPHLVLDTVYSAFYKRDRNEYNLIDKQVKGIFTDYLNKKVKLCPVIDTQMFEPTACLANYFIPSCKEYEMLSPEELSYRDTPIYYGATAISYKDDVLIALGLKEKKTKAKRSKKK